MITKEQLLARRAQLENELASHRSVQAAAAADITRLEASRSRARDMENATGGHIQNIDYWLGEIARQEKALSAERAQEPKEQATQ